MSPEELNHVQFLLKYRAVKLCAPKERLTIFRKRAVESFGDMPEYGHNWARDTRNSNFGQGSLWEHSSDQIIPPCKTLQHWKEPKYQQGKKYISDSSLPPGGSRSSFSQKEAVLLASLPAPHPAQPLPLLTSNHL